MSSHPVAVQGDKGGAAGACGVGGDSNNQTSAKTPRADVFYAATRRARQTSLSSRKNCQASGSPLLFASVFVLALDAGGATGALGYAHSVLGLGFAAIAGLSGGYPILIRLGDSRIARMRVDSDGAIGALSDARSIRVLGCAAIAGLGSCYSVLVLVDNSSFARIRVGYNGSLTIAGRCNKQTRDHQ